MALRGFASVLVVSLGLARDPGCGGVDDPNGGPNAPCTRSNDCEKGLVCSEGVCRDPKAPDAGRREAPPSDAGGGTD